MRVTFVGSCSEPAIRQTLGTREVASWEEAKQVASQLARGASIEFRQVFGTSDEGEERMLLLDLFFNCDPRSSAPASPPPSAPNAPAPQAPPASSSSSGAGVLVLALAAWAAYELLRKRRR